MRISLLLLFVSLVQVHANVYAQTNSRVTLDIESSTIEAVFKNIQDQTGYRFLYDTESINLNRKVSLTANNSKLERVLDRIFRRTNIDYVIVDKQIILRLSKEQQPSSATLQVASEPSTKTVQRQITGTVYDEDNTPLPGVSVLVRGTQRGVATDFDGVFTMNAETGETLVLSYLGFLDFLVEITEVDTYEVKMVSTSFQLEGVELVSTGYQKIEKERATGSFERVKEKTLGRKINQDIVSKIRGEVSGVLFDPNVNSRDGNNTIGITIRGISSLRANTEPLVVVDGFPIRGGFNTINPNDVERISILKDAAAASIWGIRATNGVIVIVTKKGSRNNKIAVDVSTNSSFTLKQDIFNSPYATPQTQTDYQQARFNTDGYFREDELFAGELGFRSFNQVNRVFEALGLAQRGDITQQEANARVQALRQSDARRQYASLFLRPRLWNQYNLALAAGGEKYNGRASVTYNKNEGEVARNTSDQFIVNFSNNFEVTSKLALRASVNFSSTRTRNDNVTGPREFFNQNAVNELIVDADGSLIPSTIGANQQSSDLALARGYAYPWTFNLKQELDNTNVLDTNAELRLQAGITYTLVDGLALDMSYQYEWGQNDRRNLMNEQTFTTRALVNSFTQQDNNGIASEFPVPIGSILDLSYGNLATNTLRAQLNYDKSFSEGAHQVSAIAGYEARTTIFQSTTDRKYGYNDQSLVNIRPDFATLFLQPLAGFSQREEIPENSSVGFIENRFLSYYANASYTYKYKYTLSGSTRLDDTNLFGASEKFRNIPLYSLGFKWNLSEEFFSDNNTVNSLGFRATYGINGNVDRSTSPFLQSRSAVDVFTFGNVFSSIVTAPNPELRLEKTETLNLGLDIGFFNNKVSGSIEYYEKNSVNLLADKQLNPTSGLSSNLLNVGELYNKGVDVNLNLVFVDNPNFAFNSTFNFSLNENKVTKVDVAQENVPNYISGIAIVPGNPLNTVYSFNYAGLDGNGVPQYINENNELVTENDANEGSITSVDALINEGTTVPRYYGSLINDFRYKNLSLRVLTTYVAGHVFRNTNSYNPATGGFTTFEDFNDRWQNPGDQEFTDIPALPSRFDSNSNVFENYASANKFVDNAANIRLSEVILGYSFPEKLVSKLSATSLNVSLQATNLKVWDFNRWNVDPLNPLFPRSPTFSLNLSATF